MKSIFSQSAVLYQLSYGVIPFLQRTFHTTNITTFSLTSKKNHIFFSKGVVFYGDTLDFTVQTLYSTPKQSVFS